MQLPEIPEFEVLRLLGEGASCRVHLARERAGLQRLVALKVFGGEAGREAYTRELKMLTVIEELRRRERVVEIVPSLGSGTHGELCYIALEFQEGGSLEDVVLREGPLELGEALEAIRQAGRALQLLHDEGLFHRDVKPANLLIGSDRCVRLADFGLSRSVGGTLTAAGSPAFAAPEVIAGKSTDGRLADVYSLGATLAFLLTGETILPGRVDVFALERAGVPRSLHPSIVSATALDVSERTPSVQALLDALAAPDPVAFGDAPAEDTPTSAPVHDADLEREEKVSKTIERAAYAAAGATLLPIPGSEFVAVLPIQAAMVVEIGRHHGVELDRDGASKLLGQITTTLGISVLGTRVASAAAKVFLPGLGGLLGAPFMYASTVALGTVADDYFAHDGLDRESMRDLYRKSLRRARRRFDPRRTQPADDPEKEDRLAQVEHLLAKGLIEPHEAAEVRARILGN